MFVSSALSAAARGWSVLPLATGGKTPVIRAWLDRATTDADTIRSWWTWRPNANIGITCGPSGLLVIDLDPGATPPELDPTFTVCTPRGVHLYFRVPPGISLRSTVGLLGPHIDTRGTGGYVVAPGSRTPAGLYQIQHDRPLATLPDALISQLTHHPEPAPQPQQQPVHDPGPYLRAILHREAHGVTTAEVGQRRWTLLGAARTLGRLVAGHALTREHATTVLTDAAAPHVGVEDFTRAEVARTITSGLDYGAQLPRFLGPRGRP